MIYLSGAYRREIIGKHPNLGLMLTPLMGNAIPFDTGVTWGADNGCFTRPHLFDPDRYLAWLAARPAATCLFATAPDVVGDAAATLRRSVPFFDRIRQTGHRPALVAQNGLEALTIPWDAFDVLFVGGGKGPDGREWKLGPECAQIVREAKARGKWVHMGRVNSETRLRYSEQIGCDSADGTFIAFAPDANLPKVVGWLRGLDSGRQMALVA